MEQSLFFQNWVGSDTPHPWGFSLWRAGQTFLTRNTVVVVVVRVDKIKVKTKCSGKTLWWKMWKCKDKRKQRIITFQCQEVMPSGDIHLKKHSNVVWVILLHVYVWRLKPPIVWNKIENITEWFSLHVTRHSWRSWLQTVVWDNEQTHYEANTSVWYGETQLLPRSHLCSGNCIVTLKQHLPHSDSTNKRCKKTT